MGNSEEKQTNEEQKDEYKEEKEEENIDNSFDYSFYKKLESTLKEQANQKKKQLNKGDNNIKLKPGKKIIPIVGQFKPGKSTFLNSIFFERNNWENSLLMDYPGLVHE